MFSWNLVSHIAGDTSLLAAILSVPPVNIEPRQREGAVWYAAGAPSFSYSNNIYTVIVFHYFDLVHFASQRSANVCVDQRSVYECFHTRLYMCVLLTHFSCYLILTSHFCTRGTLCPPPRWEPSLKRLH